MTDSEYLRHPVDATVEAVDQQLRETLAAAHDVNAGLAAVKAAARHRDVDAAVAAVDTQLRAVLHIAHDIEDGLAAVKSAAQATTTASHHDSRDLSSPHEGTEPAGHAPESGKSERDEAQAVFQAALDDLERADDDHCDPMKLFTECGSGWKVVSINVHCGTSAQPAILRTFRRALHNENADLEWPGH